MNRYATLALALSWLGCSAATASAPSAACDAEAYKTQLLNCSVAAVRCVQSGGTDDECGSVCDREWADWQARCSQ